MVKVSVIGLGFVGLTTALGFAEKGFDVSGYDISSERTQSIEKGIVPFYEKGLDDALIYFLGNNFHIMRSAADAVNNADVCFFCVGTPGMEDGSADLSYLFAAIDSVVSIISEKCVLAIKSTVPPGTLKDRITPYIRDKGTINPIVSNPEFLREGKCWEDFMNPDRIVCGVSNIDAKQVFAELYRPFGAPLHFVEPNTAEFIKYLSNALLATLVSFSNEMSLIADAVGVDEIAKAFRVLHEDKRLAGAGINHYLYPGCGYGGYCLPKDTTALAAHAKTNGLEPNILNSVIRLNNEMPQRTASRIEQLAKSKDEKIGILGLSFKPDSDDVRYAPAAMIIKSLIEDGYYNIYAYDPIALDAFKKTYNLNIQYCESADALCEICDIIAVVTSWQQFQGLNKEYIQKKWCDCRYWLEEK